MEVEMMMGKLSEDVVIEIFDRIPIKQLTRLKCLSKGWCRSISHYRRSRPRSSNSTLVLQYKLPDVVQDIQVTFFDVKEHVNQTEETIVVETLENPSLSFSIDHNFHLCGCSDGLMLFRNCIYSEGLPMFTRVILCNPILNQWVSLPRIALDYLDICMGLAYDCVPQQHFKVVICRFSDILTYSTDIRVHVYSSDTGKWRENTTQVFNSSILIKGPVRPQMSYLYRKGKDTIHWEFNGGFMLVYHSKKNFFKMVKLPTTVGCLWESEGYLHFCGKNITHEFSIWKFVEDEVFDTPFDDEDDMANWQRKHTLEFHLLEPHFLEIIGPDSLKLLKNMIVEVLGFDEDLQILYIAIPDVVLSYSLETRRLKKVLSISTSRSIWGVLPWLWASFLMQPSGLKLPLGADCKLLYPKRECGGSLARTCILLE